METFTKVNGLIIMHMVMESITLLMEINIKEIGNTIYKMDQVKNLNMIKISQENSKKVKRMAKVHLRKRTTSNLLAIS